MMNFKIQGFFTTLIIGTVSALTISDAISQKVNAQATPSCNNATIKGSYGTKFTGTFAATPIAVVGLVQFDGNGNFQGIDALSSDGAVSPNRIVSGTYSVRQDCTVQIVFTGGNGTAFLSGAIVDGGKEIFLIQTNPGSVLTGTFKKVN
ncbi:hypothetical protein LC605_02505 [Nostoc sp. CHAB 5836]|uniref:hypothetical protein n=1 Tax=Nostoc sp. CHAB 5836 TaxID=2780404 RepID=UPI001E4CBCE1|nr:hypothetical protein [Nostoc sp. CHAB 5836]MCC5613965.1 hypothetical protein [Nostoc sp. CHAB 5836]